MTPSLIFLLPSTVLSVIISYCGTVDFHELYFTGDRLLQAKLNSQECAVYYSNKDEYGQYVPWCEYLLRRLKGLRSISITVEANRLPVLKPDLVALTSASWEVVRSIRLEEDLEEGADCIATPGFGLLDLASFPHLTQIHHVLVDNSQYSLPPPWQVNTQLSGYIPLLPHLTHLSLGKVFEYTQEELGSLPPHLESLLLAAYKLIGFSWLRALTNLKRLEIRQMKVWASLESDFAEEDAVARSLPLVELVCPNLKRFRGNFDGQLMEGPHLYPQFFSALRELKTLELPHFELSLENWSVLCKVETASFLVKIRRYLPKFKFPPSLSKLSIINQADHSLPSMLATNLTHFQDFDLVLNADLVSCFPQTLVSLEASRIAHEEMTCPLLPRRLKRLMLQSCIFQKTLPLLHGGVHICRDWRKVFVQSYSDASSGPEWTDFFGALLKNDLDILSSIIREFHSNDGADMYWNDRNDWDKASSNTSSILNSLEWLLKRGLLASPTQVGAINKVRFFKFINSSSDMILFRWMADRLTKNGWLSLSQEIVNERLTGPEYHEILNCFKNAGFSVAESS